MNGQRVHPSVASGQVAWWAGGILLVICTAMVLYLPPLIVFGALLAIAEALAGLQGLVLHGDFDDRLPVAFAEQSVALLGSLGVPFTHQRYPAAHEITRDMAVDFVAWLARLLPADEV